MDPVRRNVGKRYSDMREAHNIRIRDKAPLKVEYGVAVKRNIEIDGACCKFVGRANTSQRYLDTT